jgi:hypothetical protein
MLEFIFFFKTISNTYNALQGILDGKGCFISSFKVLQSNNYDFLLLQQCPCEHKEQLRAKEAEYIKSSECVNRNIPQQIFEEWYNPNRLELLETKTANLPNYNYLNC